MHAVLKAIPPISALLVVGDVDQSRATFLHALAFASSRARALRRFALRVRRLRKMRSRLVTMGAAPL